MNIRLNSGSIRLMRESELAEIAEIDAQVSPHPWSEQIFKDCLKAKYHCFIFEKGDALLGYGVLSVVMKEAHILNICILPKKQGRGLGRELIDYMIDLSTEKQVEMMFLEVRVSNEAARYLYERVGFNEVGIRSDYYPTAKGREDAMVLAMCL
ncbi:MAG: ribosomal protein S18-alanine N-acetyltransferase [Gammaproteobacteria bacterium]|nr:ribosomal protein S18-alanine N-acetyltransferase [Gammaproteobacteria bacterium]MCF6229702.1 ribosomal protein S18-alanine N-acetyltransferase [Gammaproteobacteria bacterium]